MNIPSQPATAAHAMPTTSTAAAGWSAWQPPLPRCQRAVAAAEGGLLPYPLAIAPEHALDGCSIDAAGIPRLNSADEERAYDPIRITHYGLAAWNTYLRTGDERYRAAVLAQARWLLAREIALPSGGGGWPIPTPQPEVYAFHPWLSAEAQSGALSLLLRAYQLTGESAYGAAATRAAATFTRDILDGGVLAPAGAEGTVFEEIAVYPAAHALVGYLHAFLGLYDYRAFALGDPEEIALAPVLEAAHATLHTLLPHYDAGAWTYADLLRHQLAAPERHRWHAILLATLARFSGCEECAQRAQRWQRALRHPLKRPRAALARRASALRQGARALSRRVVYPRAAAAATIPPEAPMPVSVPITAYPVPGGMRAVMRTWVSVMSGLWTMRFLARGIGPNTNGEAIESFELKVRPLGPETSAPSQFPNVWFYVFAGYRKLRALVRAQPEIRLLLPQDGIFTAAFSGLIGRRAGLRVVSMDHGNVNSLFDPVWYREQATRLQRFRRLKRITSALRLRLYYPSLRLLLRIAVRHTDAFLVASDLGVDAYVQRLGVPAYKVTRIPWTVDTERLAPRTGMARASSRARFGVPADAILISMVNRLDLVKGMNVATQALGELYAALPPALRDQVQVVIAGDGPARSQVEADLDQLGLREHVHLWGMATPEDVTALLSSSDIFLYTAVRDNNPVAVVEAMGAGCASVGTNSTRHIGMNYADGRGIVVPVGDAAAIGAALAELVRDDAKRAAMGERARQYVLARHTPEVARRALLRATFYAPLLPTSASSAPPQAPRSE